MNRRAAKYLVGADRFSQGLFQGPSAPQPCMQEIVIDAVTLRAFRKGHSLTFKLNNAIGAFVAILKLSGSPDAILFRIRAGVVQSVKSVAVWLSPHVSEKRFKRGVPFLAHGDTAPPIVLEVGAIGFGASPPHIDPNAIFWRPLHAMLTVGNLRPLRGYFTAKASTALGLAGLQIGESYPPLRAAIALAKTLPARRLNDSPAAHF